MSNTRITNACELLLSHALSEHRLIYWKYALEAIIKTVHDKCLLFMLDCIARKVKYMCEYINYTVSLVSLYQTSSLIKDGYGFLTIDMSFYLITDHIIRRMM